MPREPRRVPDTNVSRARHLTLPSLAIVLLSVALPASADALAVRRVTLSPPAVQMQAAQARQFRAYAEYSDGSVREITTIAEWTTGSSRIAIVSTTPGSIGIVTAVGPGTVKINAAITVDGAKTKGSADVTVAAPPLASITTKPSTKKLEVGVSTQFKATAKYVNESEADVTAQVVWTSTNPAVATVDNSGSTKGLVRPRGIGTTTIIARDPATGIQNSDGATEVRSQITRLTVEPNDVVTARRVRLPLRCYGNRADGSRTNLTSDVDWGSTNTGAVSVGNGPLDGGVVRGLADGVAQIHCIDQKRNLSTLKSGGGATVTVAGRLVGLDVRPVTLTVGEEKGARVLGLLHNGQTTGDLSQAVLWSVEGPPIATVGNDGSDRGDVLGLQRGTATLKAVEPITGIASSDTNNLKVVGALVSVAMESGGGVVGLGEVVEFKARGTFEGGTTSNVSEKCAWKADQPRFAKVSDVSPDKGIVTGIRRGSTVIRANCSGIEASAAVRVIGNLTGLRLSPASFEDEALAEKKFHAIGMYDGGADERDVTKLVSWTSSKPDVVSIDSENEPGLSRLLKVGTAVVTATHPTAPFVAHATVVVKPGIQSLEIVPKTKTVRGSVHARLRAQGRRADGSVKTVTKQVTWTADDPQIARIDPVEKGTVYGGSKEGTTMVRASLPGGLQAAIPFTTQGLVVSFEFVRTSRTIPLLEARKVEVRARYTDGGTKTINRGVVYTSSDPNVAIVSNDPGSHGLVTAVGRGAAVITAFDPSSGKSSTNSVAITVP
jgi:uncharacterized protein YjdB